MYSKRDAKRAVKKLESMMNAIERIDSKEAIRAEFIWHEIQAISAVFGLDCNPKVRKRITEAFSKENN